MTNSSFGLGFGQLRVQDLPRYLSGDPKAQLIDVREPEEVAIAWIPGFEVLPLSEFAQWSTQIHQKFEPEIETLVLCHHGVRSAQMCNWLVSQGFTQVKNISGGIAAYALVVDSSIPQY
ncbi:MAG: rhodanese-like domain-containing protein [Pseudanabaenaceae cyanobacterium bins.68]|nr:rhodanese-like domain-containing protein [Pseudanabaenaceae cyanobacterium bins.68]